MTRANYWSSLLRRYLPEFATADILGRWSWELIAIAAFIEFADPPELQALRKEGQPSRSPNGWRPNDALERLSRLTPLQLEAVLLGVDEDTLAVYKASECPPGLPEHLTDRKSGRKRRCRPKAKASFVWKWAET